MFSLKCGGCPGGGEGVWVKLSPAQQQQGSKPAGSGVVPPPKHALHLPAESPSCVWYVVRMIDIPYSTK